MMMRTYGYRMKFWFIPLIVVAIAAFSAVTMLLWNALMPLIFHLPVITFWQALGLLILGRLFFGGGRPHACWGRSRWRHGWKEHMAKMTPEQREEFFRKMRHRSHFWQEEPPKKEAGE